MSNKLTPKEMKAFEKHLQSKFPNLGITVTPYPNMEWKIDVRNVEDCDIESLKHEAEKWYEENKGVGCQFGKFRHLD